MELSLTQLKEGESGIIVSISTPRRRGYGRHGHTRGFQKRLEDMGFRHGRTWGFQKRLEDMGVTPGTRVTVVKSAPFHGPVELHVRGSRLAIGRGMAERILVRVER